MKTTNTTAFPAVQCGCQMPFVCHLNSYRSILCVTARPDGGFDLWGSRYHCVPLSEPPGAGRGSKYVLYGNRERVSLLHPPPRPHLEVFKAEITAISSQTSPGMKRLQLRRAQHCHTACSWANVTVYCPLGLHREKLCCVLLCWYSFTFLLLLQGCRTTAPSCCG